MLEGDIKRYLPDTSTTSQPPAAKAPAPKAEPDILTAADIKPSKALLSRLASVNREIDHYLRLHKLAFGRTKRRRHVELKDIPVVPQIDVQILERIESGKGHLDMSSWHTCKTTHCRAGWATTLAGFKGYNLERLCSEDGGREEGTSPAAALIYFASDPGLTRQPDFGCGEDAAMESMRKAATRQKRAAKRSR